MAKNFLSGLFGRKKDDADKESAESTSEETIEDRNGKLDADPTSAKSDADRDVAPPSASPVEDTEAGPSPEMLAEENYAPIDPSPVEPSPGDKPPQGEDTQSPATDEPEPEAPAGQQDAKKTDADDGGKSGWFNRLSKGLSKSSAKLTSGVTDIFKKRKLDDETLEELEDLLITADLGVDAAGRIVNALAKDKFDKEISTADVRKALAGEVARTLQPLEAPLSIDRDRKPHIILMIGVNGAGKTTTIGKLAQKFNIDGLSVMLAAGDTFRAAAIEQLSAWGERTGAPVISREVGADAAGLAYDAVTAARESGVDVLMIDTAGRLQNKTALMDELAKIVRVLKKLDADAPHDVVLVLDATVGQNALSQAQVFSEIAGVTGLVMTKLDGTARGGVLVALADKFSLPIHFIGVGESVDDLQPFDAQSFAAALAGEAA